MQNWLANIPQLPNCFFCWCDRPVIFISLYIKAQGPYWRLGAVLHQFFLFTLLFRLLSKFLTFLLKKVHFFKHVFSSTDAHCFILCKDIGYLFLVRWGVFTGFCINSFNFFNFLNFPRLIDTVRSLKYHKSYLINIGWQNGDPITQPKLPQI